MVQIHKDYPLDDLNTFAVRESCQHISFIRSEADLQYAIQQFKKPFLILGGGSNMLITNEIRQHVLCNEIKGKEIIDDGPDEAIVKCGSGEEWHEFVQWTLSRNLFGLENLSLIPGKVGAAPIQNIGAYGVEVKEHIQMVEGIVLADGSKQCFSNAACHFAYRDSIFKDLWKGRICITQVYFRLSKKPSLKLEYGAIKKQLDSMGFDIVTPQAVSEAVIAIRQSKLPDPKVLGNAGSFFKNPVVPIATFEILKDEFPDMPHYDAPGEMIKIPAAWLIEACGYKGRRMGKVGSYEKHALVIVNYGGAKGKEVLEYADQIIQEVKAKFGISLVPEVNLIG